MRIISTEYRRYYMMQYTEVLPALPPGNRPINPPPKKVIKRRIKRRVGTC